MTTPVQEAVSAPEPFVQYAAPKIKAVKPRKKAQKAKASGRKRNQDQPVQQPVEPLIGTGGDLLGENGPHG